MNPAYLATIVLLFVNLCLFTPNSLAQNERGYKGAIDKKRMLSIFEAGKDDPEKGWVDGYVVEGNDVIEIIRDSKHSIKIRNSVIKGGLDFTQLPAKSVDELEKPPNWDGKRWQKWLDNAKCYKKKVNIVSNKIYISESNIDAKVNHELKSSYDNPFVLVFSDLVSFWHDIFNDHVSFNGAIFNGGSVFEEAVFNENTDFNEASFSRDAYFERATFNGRAGFDRTTFRGNETVFQRATFSKVSSFWEATFSNDAYFEGATFSGNVAFNEATFGGKAIFDGATFSRDVLFERATFHGSSFFHETTFSGNINFSDTTFTHNAVFHGFTFSGDAVFNRVTFGDFAAFNRTTFHKEAYFIGATFSEDAAFIETKFTKDVNFHEATIKKNAGFSKSTFNGNAKFSSVIFSGYAGFRKTAFNGDADFSGADILGKADFRESIFSKVLVLDKVKIKKYADLRDATIKQLSFYNRESPVIIESRVDLRNSNISEAHFEDTIFEKDIDFSDAKLGSIIFRFVTFESNAFFIRTKFYDRFAFERVSLQNEVNFTEANFINTTNNNKKRFCLSHFKFNSLIINWNQFPNPIYWVTNSSERLNIFRYQDETSKIDSQEISTPPSEEGKEKGAALLERDSKSGTRIKYC
jgi:hypothetical protein